MPWIISNSRMLATIGWKRYTSSAIPANARLSVVAVTSPGATGVRPPSAASDAMMRYPREVAEETGGAS